MILTNVLPSLSDGSGALAGRFLLLLLTKSFYGNEDLALTEKLVAELSGILNWAIAGYRRLRARGHFVQPESAAEALNDIEMLAAPVKAFIRDRCEVGIGYEVGKDDLWRAWVRWSSDEGRQTPGTKSWFGRDLRAAEPGIGDILRGPRGAQQPYHLGIRLMGVSSGLGACLDNSGLWWRGLLELDFACL